MPSSAFRVRYSRTGCRAVIWSMARMERSSTSARLSSLGSSSFMLAPCRAGCLVQDATPTGALTDAEARNRPQAVADWATAPIPVAIPLLFGALAFCVRCSAGDPVLGVRGRISHRLRRVLHRRSCRLREALRRVHGGLHHRPVLPHLGLHGLRLGSSKLRLDLRDLRPPRSAAGRTVGTINPA